MLRQPPIIEDDEGEDDVMMAVNHSTPPPAQQHPSPAHPHLPHSINRHRARHTTHTDADTGATTSASTSALNSPHPVAAAAASQSSSTATSTVVFRLRVIELDHYLSPPLDHIDPLYSLFSMLPIPALPIIRVFGRTPAGQQACAHIHGVFPYLYVNLSEAAWDQSMELERSDAEKREKFSKQKDPIGIDEQDHTTQLNAFLSRFGACIERALRELSSLDSANRRAAAGDAAKDDAMNAAASGTTTNRVPMRGSKKPYIHSMCVVRAKSIYGYQPTDKPYIKISFYDPSVLRRVGSILQSGCILSVPFEVYESHIPFHLQFMADSNVSGMDFLDFGQGVEFRQPLPVNYIATQDPIMTECNSRNEKHGRGDGRRGVDARIAIGYEKDEVMKDTASTTIDPTRRLDVPIELTIQQGASRIWTSTSTPSHLLASIRRPKVTRCEIEVDAAVSSIVNMERSASVRQPLEEAKHEKKMVQSLAELWDGERERRRRMKERMRREHAVASSSSQPQSSSQPLILTPSQLTPAPSPDRLPLDQSNIEKSYAMHIDKVVEREVKYLKQHQNSDSDINMMQNIKQEQHPTAAAISIPSVAAPTSLMTSPRIRTVESPAQATSSSQVDDIDALLREVNDDAPESMLTSAIRDAHQAVHAASSSPGPAIKNASMTASNRVNIDSLPSAFSMSQLPLPVIASHSESSQHHLSQPHLPDSSQSQPRNPTSFFFSQVNPSQAHSRSLSPTPIGQFLRPSQQQRESPFRSIVNNTDSLFPASQRHSPHLLELAASAYVSQLPQDMAANDNETGDEASQSSQSSALWFDPAKFFASQVSFDREVQEESKREEAELARKLQEDDAESSQHQGELELDIDAAIREEEKAELEAQADVMRHVSLDDDEQNEAKEDEVRKKESALNVKSEEKSNATMLHEDQPPPLEQPKLEEAKVAITAAPLKSSDLPAPAISSLHRPQQSHYLPVALPLPIVDSQSQSVFEESPPLPSLPPTAAAAAPPLMIPVPTKLSLLDPPLTLPPSPSSMMDVDSFASPPRSPQQQQHSPHTPATTITTPIKSAQLEKQQVSVTHPVAPPAKPPPSMTNPSTESISLLSPLPLPSTSSLHFERILSSRLFPSPDGGTARIRKYKMQLCYSDGSIVPESAGGVKWFSEARIHKRQDLIRAFVNRSNLTNINQSTLTTTSAGSPLPSKQTTSPHSTTPLTSPQSAAAALLIQARLNHKNSRGTPTSSSLAHSPLAVKAQLIAASHLPLPVGPSSASKPPLLPKSTSKVATNSRTMRKVMPPVPIRPFDDEPTTSTNNLAQLQPHKPATTSMLPSTISSPQAPLHHPQSHPPSRTRSSTSIQGDDIIIPASPILDDDSVVSNSSSASKHSNRSKDSESNKRSTPPIVNRSANVLVSPLRTPPATPDTQFNILQNELDYEPVKQPATSSMSAPIPSTVDIVVPSSPASSTSSTSPHLKPRHPIFDLSHSSKNDNPAPSTPVSLGSLSLSLPISAPSGNTKNLPQPAEVKVNGSDLAARRIHTNLYTHDEVVYTYSPDQKLHFDSIQLSSSEIHILRTPPPTTQSLLASCHEHHIYPIIPQRPYYSNAEHYKQYIASQQANQASNALNVHTYAAAALGPDAASAVSTGILPPHGIVQFMKKVNFVKPANYVRNLPAFDEFHPRSSLDSILQPSPSQPLFTPSISTPSVHHSLRYSHVFQFAAPPPTLEQLSATSKNWGREIREWKKKEKQQEKRKNDLKQRSATHLKPLLPYTRPDLASAHAVIAVARDVNAGQSDAESDSEEDEEVRRALPRPASPKHDESCMLSYSYFQPATSTKPLKPSTQQQQRTSMKSTQHSARKATQHSETTSITSPRIIPPSAQKLTNSIRSGQKRTREYGALSSKTALPLPMLSPSDESSMSQLNSPLFAPAAVIVASTPGGASTPPNGQIRLSSPAPVVEPPTPAKVPRLATAISSPHASSNTSFQLLPTTAASQDGSRTQRRHAESQIEGPQSQMAATPIRYNLQSDASLRVDISEQQHLSIMSLEIFACSRDQLQPDPRSDAVSAIVYCLRNHVHGEHDHQPDLKGVLIWPHACEEEKNDSGVAAAAAAASVPRSCSICSPDCSLPFLSFPPDTLIQYFPSETTLLDGFTHLIHRLDPDIILGWEIQKNSLGYIVERAHYLNRIPMQMELSRILPTPEESAHNKKGVDGFKGAERDRSNPAASYAWSHASGLTIPGRIILNLWRIMRDELKLTSYSFENCAAHILSQRFPSFPPYVKTRWWKSTIQIGDEGRCARHLKSTAKSLSHASMPYAANGMYRVLNYQMQRCCANIAIVEQLDLIGRTAELARVFGMKFYSVLDRGSQYRVESMLLRLSKPQNYLLLSISPIQRSNQPAMECLPLIMEPISNFYTDPVIVLDFQSLYPSMMIAYNICFSTCLGRVPIGGRVEQKSEQTRPAATAAVAPVFDPSSQVSKQSQTSDVDMEQSELQPQAPTSVAPPSVPTPLTASSAASLLSPPPRVHKLGGAEITRSTSLLGALNHSSSLWISSNGVMFTRSHVKQGLLPRMLREILATRVMVKTSMKRREVMEHRGLHRLLNARQFGLKLISNVTYGYTAAGFSGRMPCAEIADSIVQSARDTLERAIRMVDSNPKWRARVVYGDTDSLFVLLPGRTRQEAFVIGNEIAAHVTAANPKPVKLQMDKVFLPCCLLSKKRYVGYKYESPSQVTPSFDAKGIETVRRDGCPAVVKIMETMLRHLFETRDLSATRTYLERQWSKIWCGRVSIRDFIFAKEVRLGNYKQPPLAAVLANRMIQQDARTSPLYAERVPYVIVDGPPQARLVDRLQHPLTLLIRPDLYRLCASYYIEVVINRPLMRVLDLIGVDISQWYSAWSRPRRQPLAPPIQRTLRASDDPTAPPRSSVVRRGLPSPIHGAGASLRSADSSLYSHRRTIDQYYISQHCLECNALTNATFCASCRARSYDEVTGDLALASIGAPLRLAWYDHLQSAERAYHLAMNVCGDCMGNKTHAMGECGGRELVAGSIQHAAGNTIKLTQSVPHTHTPCTSLECPNQFTRQSRYQALQHIQAIVEELQK